jgi:hypothetical protein
MFDEHKENEADYKRKLKAYKETYLEFRYDSPSTTLEDNFSTSNFNQYEASPSGEAQEVQSSALVEMKGRDLLEEAMVNKQWHNLKSKSQ